MMPGPELTDVTLLYKGEGHLEAHKILLRTATQFHNFFLRLTILSSNLFNRSRFFSSSVNLNLLIYFERSYDLVYVVYFRLREVDLLHTNPNLQ